MHHDSSEVTLNVCLGREFTGANLSFCGRFGDADHRRRKLVYEHVKGVRKNRVKATLACPGPSF